MRRVRSLLSLSALFCVMSLHAQTVLRFNGNVGEDWMAANVWLNESGTPVSWSDGSIAILSNHLGRSASTTIVALTNTVNVYKLCDHFNGAIFHSIGGGGQMNIGEGGLEQNTGGELNTGIRIHVTTSQTWTALNPVNNSMVCLSGVMTAEPGVILTVAGSLRFRVHMNASSWTEDETVLFKDNAQYWPSASGRFGSAKIILDGATATRDMVSIQGTDMPIVGAPYFGSSLVLSNAPALTLSDRTLNIPVIQSGGTGTALFKNSGARLRLVPAETTFDVASPVRIYNTFTNNGAVPSSLRKQGPSTLELAGAQWFTGGIAIDEGTLLASVNGAVSNAPVSIAAGSTLQLAMPSSPVVEPISGDGMLVKSGTGTVNLMTTNTFSGGTTVSGGVLGIMGLAALGSGPITLSGGMVRWLVSETIASPGTITGAGTLCAGANTTLEWTGDYSASDTRRLAADAGGVVVIPNLSGSGFVKTDNGRLRLLGTSGYSGSILVATGILEIASTDLLGTGVTLCTTNSGMVVLNNFRNQDLAKITGTQSISYGGMIGELDVSTEAIPTVIATETLTIGSLTGTGALTNNQPGTIVIAGTNNFSGSIVVNAGRVVIKTPLLATLLQVNAGGTVLVDAGGLLAGTPLSLAASSTLIVTNSGSLGSGVLNLSAGVLRLSAGGSVGTRAITTSGGSLEVYDGAALDSATLTLSGGSLKFYRTSTIKIPVVQTAAMSIESYTDTGYSKTVGTFAGAITATSGKTAIKSASGKEGQVVFAGGATYSGGELFVQSYAEWVIVSNRVTQPTYCGTESGGKRILVKDGGSLDMRGGSGNHLFIGVGSAGVLEVATNGTVNLGAVQLTVGHSTGGNGEVLLNGGAVVVTNTASNIRLGNGASNSSGTLTLNSGTLQIVKPLLLAGTSGTVTFNGGTLNVKANSATGVIPSAVPITVLSNGGTLDVETNIVKLGSAGISGPGTLRIIGGRVDFDTASPQWTGGVAVVSGEVSLAPDTFYGSLLDVGSGTIRLAGTNTIASVSGTGGTLVLSGTTTVANISGTLTKAGTGQLNVKATAADLALSVSEGTVAYVGADAVPQTISPAVWIDASVTASMVTNATAGITRLYDRRTPGETNGFYAEPLYNPPVFTNRALNGYPIMDFGVSTANYSGGGDNRMLQFNQKLANIRSVVWVIGSRNGGGFLLGDDVDSTGRYFHRGNLGPSETYGTRSADPLWLSCTRNALITAGETRINGTAVNGTTTGLSGAWDQVSWRLSQGDDALATSPISAIWFASCYANNLGRLNGGQDLAEVLIYTNRLNDAELAAVESYLHQKWFAQTTIAHLNLATNTSFVNLSEQPLVIQHLTVQGTNVQVVGNAITVEQATVQSGATFDPRALNVQFASLTFEDNALYLIDSDNMRLVTVASVNFPVTMKFSIIGQTLLASKQQLLDAQTITGSPIWLPVGKAARSAKVSLLANNTELWVQMMLGTFISIR